MRNRNNQNKRLGRGYVRIIAGEWRGRKITVADSEGLRPTTDRIRETVFNWLMPYLADSVCLDACAGTGILGLECLSRGAKSVDFVEKDRLSSKNLESNLRDLGGDGVVHNTSIQQFIASLSSSKRTYDIVFIDPPFAADLQEMICRQLFEAECLSPSALVYVESELKHDFDLPNSWEILRENRSSKVKYQLLRCG